MLLRSQSEAAPRVAPICVEKERRQRCRHVGSAGRDYCDRFDDLFRTRILADVPRRASADGFHHVLTLSRARHHENPRVGSDQVLDGRTSLQPRQVQVQHDHSRSYRPCVERLDVRICTHQLEPDRIVHEHRQPVPEHRMILDDRHPDHARTLCPAPFQRHCERGRNAPVPTRGRAVMLHAWRRARAQLRSISMPTFHWFVPASHELLSGLDW